MEVYVATKNVGKLRELREIFGAIGWDVSIFPEYQDVVEGETSYLENAALKARTLQQQLRRSGIEKAVLGDDSGLEIRLLGGRPGVLSARYGGENVTWAQRRAALLAEVAAAGTDRTAAFVCALHLIEPDGTETAVLERLFGELSLEDRGTAGFSYDPIFLYPPLGVTFAELSDEHKNAISHRALAARALVLRLGAQGERERRQTGLPGGT